MIRRKKTNSLYILKTNIYKHENDESARHISLIISVKNKKFQIFQNNHEISRKFGKFQENSRNFKKMQDHFENKIIENLFYCSPLQCL